MPKGVIIKSIANLFSVESEGKVFECNASTKLKKNKQKLIIGDIVSFDLREDNKGYITNCDSRINSFVRPKVANVKHAILVFSILQPNMNWNLLDKFLISCEYNDVNPIIVISKTDLATKEVLDNFKSKIDYYSKWYEIFYNTEENLKSKLTNIIGNDISFLMGQSGVGKSTLLNNLDENINILTNDISLKLNRGKHTTRHTELYNVDSIKIIDTPGFGMLDITSLNAENIKGCFVDFFEFSSGCQYGAKCNHISESKCNVKNKVFNEEILQTRYDSYIELYASTRNKKW